MEGEYPRFTEFRTALNFIGRPTGNLAPRAVFVPRIGSEPYNVKLDAGAARDPDGPSPSLAWDLGDGTTSTGTQVSHTYGAPGSYTVILTATDDHGMRDVYVREVTVADPVPTALRISVSPITAEPGDTVTVGGRLVRADDPSAPVAGEWLQLLRRPLGSTEWETVLEQRTPGDGLIRFVDAPEQSTEYMWRFLGSARFDLSNSPAAQVELLVTSTGERP